MKKSLTIAMVLMICYLCLGCGGAQQTTATNQNNDSKVIMREASLVSDQADSIAKILLGCGIKKIDQFKHDAVLDNVLGEGVKGYRTKAGSVESVVYLKDGNLFYIGSNLGGEIRELYANNEIKAKVADYVLTVEEEVDLQIRCKRGIEAMLKAPKTAEFAGVADWKYSKDKERIIVQSYVDAQNSFGANMRNKFQVTFTPDKEKVTSLIMNGKEYIK